MRIGMVCPYSFDVPGGVQSHVLQLAEVMRARGHEVSVLAPASPDVDAARLRRLRGRAIPIPYNGSVARLQFSPAVHGRVRRWLAEGDFDVLHLHEPNAPEPVDVGAADRRGPDRGDLPHLDHQIADADGLQGSLRPWHEKIVGRIAVSDLARRWQMEALGSDAVEIPNGVDVESLASAPLLDGYPRPGKTVLFLGRYDEPRKGMSVLLAALPALVERFADVQLLVVGRGDEDQLRARGRRFDGPHPFSWPGRRRREGVGDAQRRRVLRAQPRRGEFRHRPGRGDGRRHRRWWPATSTLSGGCCATARPGCLVPVGDARRAGRCADRRCWTTTCCAHGTSTPGSEAVAPLRLVGGGQPDHAGVRNGRRRRAPRSRWPADDMALTIADHGAGVVLAACWPCSAPGRTRPANRLDRLHVRYDLSWQALDGALARRAVVARAVRSTPTAARPRGPAAGGAGRRRRARAAAGARSARKRAVGRAGDGRSGVAAGRPGRRAGRRRSPGAAGPPIPQRRGPRHAGAGRAAPGAIVPARRNRPAANLFRDRRAAARARASDRPTWLNHRTSARVVLLDEHRRGAAAVRFGSRRRRMAARHRDGGSPSAARCEQGEWLAEAAARELAEETGLRVASGRHDRARLAARRGLRVQRRADRAARSSSSSTAPGGSSRRRAGTPSWSAATSTATGGATQTTSPTWSAAGETVYPLQLAELLAEAAAMADAAAPAAPSCSPSARWREQTQKHLSSA